MAQYACGSGSAFLRCNTYVLAWSDHAHTLKPWCRSFYMIQYCYTHTLAALSSDELRSSLTSKQVAIINTDSLLSHSEHVGVHSSFSPGNEQDAQVFLTFLLDKLTQRMSPE